MKIGRKMRVLVKRAGISPRQTAALAAGLVFALGTVLSSWVGWQSARDTGLAGLLTVVLLLLVMVLRTLAYKAASIRRDILRQSQHQAAALHRIEANTGFMDDNASYVAARPLPPSEADPAMGNSLGSGGKYFGVGPEFEYAWRAARHLPAYENFALRTRSLAMRNVFARVATGLQFNYRDLLAVARTSRAVPLADLGQVAESWRPDGLRALARIVANQRIHSNDAATAILLFECSIQLFGIGSLDETDRQLYLEALVDERRANDAETRIKDFRMGETDPVQAALLTANLIRPIGGLGQDWSSWLHRINCVLAVDGAAPLMLTAGRGASLDRLAVTGVFPVRHGIKNKLPLVSVIIPTHNGSEFIDTALRSLTAQTWKNIELLVVDDGSSQFHLEKLRKICGEYNNVTLFEQAVNSGAYVSRNLGLKYARGEFITVHDDDDWSHPQKIERQVVPLIHSSKMIANMSMHTRVTEDLAFLRINNDTRFTQPNYSSMMFRRSVVDRIGEWDSVNRGADAEFRDRIESIYGCRVEVVGKGPLSFTRTRRGSLTHGELNRGYIDSARLIYLESYTQAHKQGIAGGPARERNFAVALDMLPQWRGKHKGKFDVVFAADFRFPGGATVLVIAEIEAAAAVGLRVGVMQLDSPLNRIGSIFPAALFAVLLQKQIILLRIHDAYDSTLLVVRHPSVVQFLDNMISPAKISACLLIANTAPVLTGGVGGIYDLEQCSNNVLSTFNVVPAIVPESGVTRKLVEQVAGNVEVADYEWPGFITLEHAGGHQVAARSPVVGRHSRDHRLKWPDKIGDFMAAYCQPKIFSTHILGGIESIAASIPEESLTTLRVTPFGGAEVRKYLSEIDFWVYFHSNRTVESFGMAVVEAMEAGLVVVLPEYMSDTFGNGAVYARPAEVSRIVERFWNSPELYEEQSRRARAYVQARYSADVYIARLQGVLAASRVEQADVHLN